MAEADCMTRVWALAIATAACIGLPSALIYAIVRLAAARRYGATFALGLVLVFWVTISAAYYPRVCADLVPALRFLRHARRRRHRASGELSLMVPQPQPSSAFAEAPFSYEHRRVPLAQRWGDRGDRDRNRDVGAFPREAAPAPAAVRVRSGDADDGRGIGRMATLPREPPAAAARGGKAPLGGADHGDYDDDVPVPRPPASYERQMSDGEPSAYCAICQEGVDEEAGTAKWLPRCLHVFHRHCIDQWLRQGKSTCPICRCNASFVVPEPDDSWVEEVRVLSDDGHGGEWAT